MRWLPRLDSHQDVRCQRPAHCWLCNKALVAREGIAPSTSLCRRDMILFHHRAKLAAGARNCTSIRVPHCGSTGPTIRRPGKNWWPARVTRPVLRIKSPLHHFNACRPKIGARGRVCTCTVDALDVVSLLVGLHERDLELCKELVKGTAELICLHGLNQLDDETYRQVLSVTDHLDLEPWMLQSGGEFWRRILAAVPDGQPLAKTLMKLARLPAGALESLIAEMIEQTESAKVHLASLEQ